MNKKCLWCGEKLVGRQKKYCSNKCKKKYTYHVVIKEKLFYATHRKIVKSQWDYKKNNKLGFDPKKLTHGSHKQVWWKCSNGHEWKQSYRRALQSKGCPYCMGRRVCEYNCLNTVSSDLSKEWHPIKNKELTPKDVTAQSSKKVWWICVNNHEWKAVIHSRYRGSNCPYCAGQKIHKDNCLNTINSTLSKEWNFIKNGGLTPKDVTARSSKKVWWICFRGHEWQASILSRAIGTGCPYCSNKKVCKDNCLLTTYPGLLKEWNYVKNKHITPDDVTFGSDKKVWWICEKGHEWKAHVYHRVKKSKCPICSINDRSGENHSNYNFNLTDEDRTDRRILSQNRSWRNIVYKRDNYTCQICGDNKGGNLNAHHLMGYNKYPKLRFNESNGITLCEKCHYGFHNIYGRGNNTIKQFIEYNKSCKLNYVKID